MDKINGKVCSNGSGHRTRLIMLISHVLHFTFTLANTGLAGGVIPVTLNSEMEVLALQYILAEGAMKDWSP